MKESVCSSCSSLYWGLFENGFRRAEKGAECELQRAMKHESGGIMVRVRVVQVPRPNGPFAQFLYFTRL